MVVCSRKKFNKYEMTINYGFGTGKIGSDYNIYNPDEDYYESGPSMSPFLSLFLNTPFFNNKMNLVFEYDGSGINLGTQIPLTDIYSLRFGISQINRIPDWARRSDPNKNGEPLQNGDPSIMVGFMMTIPDIKSDQERLKNKLLNPNGEESLYGDFQPLVIIDSSKIKEQETIIANYRDSLNIYESKINILDNENAIFKKNISILQDSTKKMLLNIEIDKSKQNNAMRNFQLSHDLLVEEKYDDALDVINRVIELQPNLAIAYARRGTIYYYLNDLKAASINWNIALKIDPEYDQVRNILQSLKQGNLEPLYKNNEEEN
jgi:tetratricopeptide (TPR) repeat protein